MKSEVGGAGSFTSIVEGRRKEAPAGESLFRIYNKQLTAPELQASATTPLSSVNMQGSD